jgi:sugar lactone lactonase YvrE
MKITYKPAVQLLTLLLAINLTTLAQQTSMESVFKDNTYQLTGVAVSKSGRMFVNYPYWTDTYRYAVVEVAKDGSVKPYPDAAWNSWKPGQDPINRWVCVQSVFVDDKDRLWVIDPASPKQEGVYRDAHKLVCINLTTNKVERTYPMKGVVGPDSYLNDIRVDTGREIVYLTESQQGGIVVVDIKSGKSRLTLQNHPSTKSDPAYKFIIDGRELRDPKGPVKFNSDGLALTPDGNVLYYKPLTDDKLYRIKTEFLRDSTASDQGVGAQVEDLGKFTSTDGMIIDPAGNLYLGDIQNYTMYRLNTTASLKRENLLTDRVRLQWPDSYAMQNGYLYITTSYIDHMAKHNGGKSTRKGPYEVFRMKIGK